MSHRWLAVGLLVIAVTVRLSSLDAVDIAKEQIGDPYVSGAAGPDAFDCSGLVRYSYAQVGTTLDNSRFKTGTQNLVADTNRINGPADLFSLLDSGLLHRGDLLFFATDVPGIVSHVGIYDSGTSMIHAPEPGQVVTETNALNASFWRSTFLFATRVGSTPTRDGYWTGSGTSKSSGDTPASVTINFDVSGNRVTGVQFPWRVDTRPGTTESASCGGNGIGGDAVVNGDSFSTGGQDSFYAVNISGTFQSTSAISGTVSLVRQSGAQSWCLSASIPWTGSKR